MKKYSRTITNNENLKRIWKRATLSEIGEKDEDFQMQILFQKKKIQKVIENCKKTNK